MERSFAPPRDAEAKRWRGLAFVAVAASCSAAAAADPKGAMSWLLAPLSGNNEHHIESWAYWHARAMLLGWGFLAPAGALVARFFKVTRQQRWPHVLDNKFWWHSHVFLQVTAMLVSAAGIWLVFAHGPGATPLARWHGWLGWSVVFLGATQILGGLLRGSKGGPTDEAASALDATTWRGDHYDMTPRRLIFERLHKSFGWISVVIAIAAIALGLVTADAPRWMLVTLLLWWGSLIVTFALWQRQGRCIDTYQAIWGPDPRHPGNRIAPVGWGIRRLS